MSESASWLMFMLLVVALTVYFAVRGDGWLLLRGFRSFNGLNLLSRGEGWTAAPDESAQPRGQSAAPPVRLPHELLSQDLQAEFGLQNGASPQALERWRNAVGAQEGVLRSLFLQVEAGLERVADTCMLQARAPQTAGVPVSLAGDTDWNTAYLRRETTLYNTPAAPGLTDSEREWQALLNAEGGPLQLFAQLRGEHQRAMALSSGHFLAARLAAPLDELESVLAAAQSGCDAQLAPEARERMRQRVLRYVVSELPAVSGNIARLPQGAAQR